MEGIKDMFMFSYRATCIRNIIYIYFTILTPGYCVIMYNKIIEDREVLWPQYSTNTHGIKDVQNSELK